MILKALDLLRELGWGFISLIFNLIDAIYEIISKINELDIVGTMANNTIFSNFYTNIIVIAISVFGLFTIWQFAKKAIDPEEGPNFTQIVKEVIKCGILILVSTFLFVQVSTFSIQLSGFVGTMIKSDNNTTLGSELLINYIDYSNGYKSSDKFENDDYQTSIRNGTFTAYQGYNDKYVVKDRWIRSDERDYKYSIQWILAILCGGFFLYALIFSAVMLAKRQIEFLVLFVISPIVYATSICNKQRRNTLIEQLVSLTLQSAMIILIINLIALVAIQINSTQFFDNDFQDMATRSILYLGCAILLLTGSNSISQFIGSSIGASAGREQLMSLMGFGRIAGGAGKATGATAFGTGMILGGAAVKGGNYLAQKTGVAGKVGRGANNLLQQTGLGIASFGNSFESNNHNPLSHGVQSVGNTIRSYGLNIASSAMKRNANNEGIGLSKKISSGTSSMMRGGLGMINPIRRTPTIRSRKK